jgi:hypothetical protein
LKEGQNVLFTFKHPGQELAQERHKSEKHAEIDDELNPIRGAQGEPPLSPAARTLKPFRTDDRVDEIRKKQNAEKAGCQ